MLRLAGTQDGDLDRLRVAAAHVESAIVHINNVIQARVPAHAPNDDGIVQLRLLVTALADIRRALSDDSPGTEVGAE
jgi:hypothetical protein